MNLTELQKATSKYATIRDYIQSVILSINPVELVTPINLLEVKTNWIENARKGVFINPTFEYDRQALLKETQKSPVLTKLKTMLSKLPPNSHTGSFIYDHLEEVIDDALNSVKLASAILSGFDDLAVAYVTAKYGKPDQSSYQLALELAKQGTKTQCKKSVIIPSRYFELLQKSELDAVFIKNMFIWSMEQYGKPWHVEIMDNCSSIDVRDKSSHGYPVIVIPSDKKVNGLKLLELIGHEIEAHWLSSQNAELIGALKVDSEIIYEGAAKLKDWRFGSKFLGETTMPSPYHIIAERTAMSGGSFADVGKIMTEYLDGDIKKAWIFTYRAFRGATKTTNRAGYAFTKDRAYLEGFLQARKMIENGDEMLLNFSTLSSKSLQNLSSLINGSGLKGKIMKDKQIQEAALYEIIHRIKRR